MLSWQKASFVAIDTSDVTAVNRNRKQLAGSMSATLAPPFDRRRRRRGESVVSSAATRGRDGGGRRLGGGVAAVALAAVLATLPAAGDAKPVCAAGQFHVRGQCYPCSACPSYLIVRRPCAPHSDTLCGPLYDFEFLNVVDSGPTDTGRHAAPSSHRRRNQSHHESDASSSSNAVDVHTGSLVARIINGDG